MRFVPAGPLSEPTAGIEKTCTAITNKEKAGVF